MSTVNKGRFVLGLEPDSRMPNDYLRMVARVFAAYREIPLEESIVAYVDGFATTIGNINGNDIRIDITQGVSFVDDQFIGFEESSDITVDGGAMIQDDPYSIVLYYKWANQFPSPKPTFLIVKTPNIDNEHMLELCGLVKRAGGNYDITDTKTPWYEELLTHITGNTEVDDASKLPYVPAIKTGEDFDIGWALDFHHHVGTGGDFNVRLHTDRNDNGNLYINNVRVLTTNDSIGGGGGGCSPVNRNYNGDGTATDFTILGYNIGEHSLFLEGVMQSDSAYTLTHVGNDTKISFAVAPNDGEWIRVHFYDCGSVVDTALFKRLHTAEGDGATTTFTVNSVFSVAEIYLDGVLALSGTYNITNNGTSSNIDFDTAPANNENLSVVYYTTQTTGNGSTDTVNNRYMNVFTGDGTTNSFTISNKIFAANADVYLDGILASDSDYAVSDDGTNTTIQFNVAPTNTTDINIWYEVNEATGVNGANTVQNLNLRDFNGNGTNTNFVCASVVFTIAKVFVDGILTADNAYSLSNDGVDTTIGFNVAPANNASIKVNYLV